MKNKILLLLLLFSFTGFAQLRLQFVTVNQYGNNLYLDNVTLGTQSNIDVGIVSIDNIKADTNYLPGSGNYMVAPVVTIFNAGKNNVTTSFNVTMTITPGVYQSTKTATAFNSGQTQQIVFDSYTITPGTAFTINVIANLPGDENPSNNTLTQFSQYFQGTVRNILFEEWTSSTCSPCAANNPTIDAFIAARFDSLTPIKYHMNWPSPGNDPMYAYNPTQNTDRRTYYGVNSVPHVILDGIVNPSYPYSSAPSLPDAFYPRKLIGSPMIITVTNTRIPGDTIKADITVQNLAPLKAGNYYLRVHAVERKIQYTTPPGSNGETIFYDVFRKAYPTSLGTPVPTAVGTYYFTFKYKLDLPTWVDTMIYTAAFVQDDVTKEVMNSGKSRNYTDAVNLSFNGDIDVQKQVVADQLVETVTPKLFSAKEDKLLNVFYYDLFEGAFPPAGWTVINPNNDMTFEQYSGANGPMFGGNKSVTLQFYSYSSTNRSDTLTSKTFTALGENDSIKFNWAYCQYQTEQDRLIVRLSTDGGATYSRTIFDRAGSTLATRPATTTNFVPSSASEWGTFSYSLYGVIPVEFTSFNSVVQGNNVLLNWSTATETNNYGFEIQRKSSDDFITVGFVKGSGTTTNQHSYSFTDKSLNIDKYTYRLKQVNFDGSYEVSNEINVDVAGPGVFSLSQNYPNPFNPVTNINFSVVTDSKVTMKIFNVLGEMVSIPIEKNYSAGTHKVEFNGTNLNSGMYFYQLEAIGSDGIKHSQTMKMLLLK